jgi:hypothetical protein
LLFFLGHRSEFFLSSLAVFRGHQYARFAWP